MNIKPILESVRGALYSAAIYPSSGYRERVRLSSLDFFQYTVGMVITHSNGHLATFADTNMRRAGALPVPQKFEADGVVVYPTDMPVVGTHAHAQWIEALEVIRDKATFVVEIGAKTYLELPASAVVPRATPPEPDEDAKDAILLEDGAALLGKRFDLLVKNDKGEDWPLLIACEQQFRATLTFGNQDDGPVIPRPMRFMAALVGTRYREIC